MRLRVRVLKYMLVRTSEAAVYKGHFNNCQAGLPPPVALFMQDWNSYLKYGLEYDCPIWHGLFDFCRLYAGASLGESRAVSQRKNEC
mgnify:CR=1 FL=1